MRRLLFFGMLSFAATLCRADLIGTTVTGFLGFSGGPTNWYDPASGFVPATGYQNSASNKNSATVQIVGGNEFGFNDGFNLDVTSFSGSGFTFTDTSVGAQGNNPITLRFTDTAFSGISEISSTFTGLTYGIVGDVVTFPASFPGSAEIFHGSRATQSPAPGPSARLYPQVHLCAFGA